MCSSPSVRRGFSANDRSVRLVCTRSPFASSLAPCRHTQLDQDQRLLINANCGRMRFEKGKDTAGPMSLLSSHSVCTQLQSRWVGAGAGREAETRETWVSVAARGKCRQFCTCNLQSSCTQTKDARKTGAPACPITPQHPLMRTYSRPRAACRPRPRRRCRAESAGPGCNSDLQWRSTT